MKTVFRTSTEVSHLWANKTQAEGRCRNMFFRDSTYYSYGTHYVIGKHLPDGSVAINLEKSSSTTNGHVQEAVYAVRPRKVLRVLNPGGNPHYESTKLHIQRLMEKAALARGNRPRLLAEAQTVADDYNAFVASLGLAGDPNFPAISAATDDAELARMRKRQREHAAEAREKQKQREAENARRRAERIPEWRAGKYVSNMFDLPTMLRLMPAIVAHREGMRGVQVVETSRGAHIPVEDAIRLWPMIQRVTRGDRDYEVGMQLGVYRLTKINRDDSIVVGCHKIPYSEIESIAVQLGLVSLEAEEQA